AVSRAQAAREPTVRALYDLDQLALARAREQAPPAPDDGEMIDVALTELAALAQEQEARLNALRARLGQP
ncbi:MAG: hypothetical protein ACFBQW_05455, partial [Sphingomonadaceae bacterium]